jgi:putative hydrolase of the HAD superfamily
MPVTTAEPFDPAPRAILLDLDDTLCDYTTARDRRLRIALADAAGLPADAPGLDVLVEASIAMQPHGSEHFRDLLAQHGYDGGDRVDAAIAWYRANRFHGLELFPDSLMVLKQLRRGPGAITGRPLGIITNGPADVQRDKVDLLQIRNLVDFVLISGEFGTSKPDPAIYTEALQRAGVTAAETVFVGDSAEHDMAGALASGIRSVWINRHGNPWPGTWSAPDRQIRHIGELPRLVGGGG